MKPKHLKLANRLIDQMGGTCHVARMFNVQRQAVSQWRRKGIPPARMMFIEIAYPELFEQTKQVPPLKSARTEVA